VATEISACGPWRTSSVELGRVVISLSTPRTTSQRQRRSVMKIEGATRAKCEGVWLFWLAGPAVQIVELVIVLVSQLEESVTSDLVSHCLSYHF
jgi:hypothetical protein